jgi:predicted amidohydrolase
MRNLILLAVLCAGMPGQAQDKIRLGLFTAMPVKWDLEANWTTFERAVEANAGQRLDMVVTPECFGRIYGFRD